MPDYLFVGSHKENLSPSTIEVHLVICNDCGFVVEKTGDTTAKCDCSIYEKISGGWVVEKKS